MARRVITEAMRETARERAHGYLAARGMSTAEVDQLAGYHARQARAFTGEARQGATCTARMLGALVARRTARAWYVAPGRAPRAARARYSRGR
jgi:hypothetical protein